MSKVFNTTAVCIPEEHYMVDISGRLKELFEQLSVLCAVAEKRLY